VSVPSIESQLPAGEGLRRLARTQLAQLARELAAAEKGATAHPLRKRLKFLRSLLRLIRPSIGDEAFQLANGHLRAAATELAFKRHGEAMIEAVSKLKRQADEGSSAIAELEAAAQAYAGDTEVAHVEGLKRARGEIDAVRVLVGTWLLPKRDTRFFLEGFQRSYGRGRKLIMKGLASGDTQTLHEARKSVIHHLHHLEILEPVWPRMIKVWCDELGRLRESLGDLNDLEELESLLSNPDTAFGKISSLDAAHALIVERRRRLLDRIRKRGDQLFAEQPKSLARRFAALWASWERREAETPED